MTSGPDPCPPWGSKQRVSKAGDNVRNGTDTLEDHAIIDAWREAHRHVINSFQAILRGRTRNTNIIVAQRHKRKRTIVDKLHRFPKMQLGRMDDVAGCRLIFPATNELIRFRDLFRTKPRFRHKLKNEPGKYNYLDHPKDSGYRGIHDIYEYDVRSEVGRERKGLLIELQYRTRYQHAWATSVEMIGLFTGDQPKFDRGDIQIRDALRYASEIIARAHEGMRSCLPNLTDRELVEQFIDINQKSNFLEMLRTLNSINTGHQTGNRRNIILMFDQSVGSKRKSLEVKAFPDATIALKFLFELERENPGLDAVLVKGDSPDDVREAFKNYFTDARDFLYLIEQGCAKLAGNSVRFFDFNIHSLKRS